MPFLSPQSAAGRGAAMLLALLLGVTLQADPADPPPSTGSSSDVPGVAPGGEFDVKAWSSVGSGFDPYTGIGRRSVTDLVVPGALFDHGLRFTRHTATSGGSIQGEIDPLPSPPIGFGRHNFQYEATDESDHVGGEGPDLQIVYRIHVRTPDKRTFKFSYYPPCRTCKDWVVPDGWLGFDPRYTLDNTAEKLRITGTFNGQYAFTFHEPDGTQVEMRYLGANWVPTRIIDPSGRALTLEYVGGNRLVRVSDAAGRYLKVTWSNVGGEWAGTQVDSGRRDGGTDTVWQSVGYGYTANGGGSVSYYSEGASPQNPLTGTYTPDAPGNNATCLDDYRNAVPPGAPIRGMQIYEPHFEGPMTRLHQRNLNYYGIPLLDGTEGYHAPDGSAPCRWVVGDRNPCPEWYSQQGPNPVYRPRQWTYEERSGVTDYLVVRWDWMCREPGATPQRYLTHARTLEQRGDGPVRQWWWGGWPNDTPEPPSPNEGVHYRVTDWSQNENDTARQTRVLTKRFQMPSRVYDALNQRQEADYTLHSAKVTSLVNADRTTYRTWEYDNPDNPGADPIWSVYQVFLHRKTDEYRRWTRYRRDALNRVWNVEHQDGSNEGFAYDANGWGLVTLHRLASGWHVHFDYDARGLLLRRWNDVEGWDSRMEYTYDAFDRVATVQDGRARASGKPYSVRLEYNGRHQITKCHYPPTGGSGDPTVTYGYDNEGNCTSITDELGHWRTFAYDEYRRCTNMTEQLNAPNWNGTATVASRAWDWKYDRYYLLNGTWQSFEATRHTDRQWSVQIEPSFNAQGDRRMTAQYFDLNNRVIRVETGWIQPAQGAWYMSSPDHAETLASYDAVGNKVSTTDAMGRPTTYEYDARNRPTAVHELLDRHTYTAYDAVGNKTQVTFPDATTQRWEGFDMWGQPASFFDERNQRTDFSYIWGPMKKRERVTTFRAKDGGGTEEQWTWFWWDQIGRPMRIVFPDQSYEHTAYEHGAVKAWRNRQGVTRASDFDARGRECNSWFDDGGVTPGIGRAWDDAGRLTILQNVFSTLTYGYDAAAQMLYEESTIAGSGGAGRVTFQRYPDGSVGHLLGLGGYRLRRDWTPRGQLKTVGWDDAPGTAWQVKLADYFWQADDKPWYVNHWNSTRTSYEYDAAGRIWTTSTHWPGGAPGGGNADYALRFHHRDARDRIWAIQKGSMTWANPMENGRGDRFAYDEEGQLFHARYEALEPAGWPEHDWQREEHWDYDQLGNRQGNSLLANYGWLAMVRRDNGLNQYAWWGGSATNYDEAFAPAAPGRANGVLVQDGQISSSFNALKQPVFLWRPGIPGGQVMFFGHDPLGRCVKRWIGADGSPTANPATYLYYEGWNLIQEGASATQMQRLYVHGARVDEIVASASYVTGQWYYHHYDGRTHCILLTATDPATGQPVIAEQYAYDAFGWPRIFDKNGAALAASATGNRFLFTGREWLPELKLYDYRNRHYHPELGRFLQPDPLHFGGKDLNLYRYCHNDPINHTDPFGLTDVKVDPKVQAMGVYLAVRLYAISRGRFDHLDRTQAILSVNGVLIGGKVTFGKIQYKGSESRTFERTGLRTEDVPEPPEGARSRGIAHLHNDINGNATTNPSDKDYNAVRSLKVPMFFISETSASKQIVRMIVPQVEGTRPQVHDLPVPNMREIMAGKFGSDGRGDGRKY